MSDSGTEFKNRAFQKFLSEESINYFYNVDDRTHASIAERVIRTIKERLYKYLYFRRTLKYITVYKRICNAYDNSFHSVIKMRPTDVKPSNIVQVYYNTKKRYKVKKRKNAELLVGSHVRIGVKSNVFKKGSRGHNYTEEVFRVKKVIQHNPTVYEIEDLLGEPIEGKFYDRELQEIYFDENGEFLVDKIHRRRTKSGIKQVFVSWVGWPEKFSSWINESDLH